LNAEQYQRIRLQGTQSTLVQKIYYETAYPNGVVHVWPVPTENDQIELSTYQQLAGSFTSGTQTFDAPPGYLEAVRYNLALRLALEWRKDPKPGVVKLAADSLATIQALNAETPQMDVNAGVLPIRTDRSGFNRLTGDFE
jgi:hypothetical protein